MGARVSEVDLEVSNQPGTLYVVATPIGHRDDITLRAIDVLRQVDCVVAENTRHSRGLLEHIGVRKPLVALHEHNETGRAPALVERLLQGESLALVSDAGTPLISDPGYVFVRACRAAGLAVVPVPGASAVIAALSVSGLPTDRFRFEGFLPRRQSARITCLEALRSERATMVFYESPQRIQASLHDFVDVFDVQREAVLARELTKRFETVAAQPLGELLAWVDQDPDQRRGELVLLLAGASHDDDAPSIDGDRLLAILLDELPLKQAAALAARITGTKKNALYQRALALSADTS